MHLPVLIESLECCRFEFIKVQLVCVHPHVQAVGGIEIFNEGRQAVVLKRKKLSIYLSKKHKRQSISEFDYRCKVNTV